MFQYLIVDGDPFLQRNDNKLFYYMAQATSCEIALSDWLRRVTCRSVSFRIGPGGLRVSSAILFTKEQRKETLKSRKNVTNLVN